MKSSVTSIHRSCCAVHYDGHIKINVAERVLVSDKVSVGNLKYLTFHFRPFAKDF